MATNITFQDYLQLRSLAFEWAQSYDTKDWERLRRCLAPSTTLDFRSFHAPLHENLSPDDYIAIISNMKVLGDKRMKTQHFIGASKLEPSSDGAVLAWYQIRAAHQRYADEDFLVVTSKGHGHGVVHHRYTKVEGIWKIEIVAPELEWSEDDLYGTLNPKDEES